MMALQHSSCKNHYIGCYLFKAKVGIFQPSYTITPSLISYFTIFNAWIPTTFYTLDCLVLGCDHRDQVNRSLRGVVSVFDHY